MRPNVKREKEKGSFVINSNGKNFLEIMLF